MGARIWNVLLAGTLASTTACGGATPAAESAPSGGPYAKSAPGDDAAARAAWDKALKLRFGGDELAAQRAMVQLAATHPDTRYGRAAAGTGALVFVGVAALGVVSAVAVPAYLKYIRRAKTALARTQVNELANGVIAYADRECARLGKACATKLKFPASTLPTPVATACENGQSRARMIDPTAWETPTWKAFGFAVKEPSLFQYQFESTGNGVGATFTVRALGDLDCDGVLSAFERSGTVNDDGSIDARGELYEQEPDE